MSLSAFILHVRASVVLSLSVDMQTGPFTVPAVGAHTNAHTWLSSVMPVVDLCCGAPMLVRRLPYITTDMLFRLIVPYLDSFEVLFTTKACSACKTLTSAIFFLVASASYGLPVNC